MRSAVVLPHPEGPTSTMNSPSAISSEKSSTAIVPSKRFVTCSKATSAMGLESSRVRGEREARRGERGVRDREREERREGRGRAGGVHDEQGEGERQRLERAVQEQGEGVARDHPQRQRALRDRERPEHELERAEREQEVPGDDGKHGRAPA